MSNALLSQHHMAVEDNSLPSSTNTNSSSSSSSSSFLLSEIVTENEDEVLPWSILLQPTTARSYRLPESIPLEKKVQVRTKKETIDSIDQAWLECFGPLKEDEADRNKEAFDFQAYCKQETERTTASELKERRIALSSSSSSSSHTLSSSSSSSSSSTFPSPPPMDIASACTYVNMSALETMTCMLNRLNPVCFKECLFPPLSRQQRLIGDQAYAFLIDASWWHALQLELLFKVKLLLRLDCLAMACVMSKEQVMDAAREFKHNLQLLLQRFQPTKRERPVVHQLHADCRWFQYRVTAQVPSVLATPHTVQLVVELQPTRLLREQTHYLETARLLLAYRMGHLVSSEALAQAQHEQPYFLLLNEQARETQSSASTLLQAVEQNNVSLLQQQQQQQQQHSKKMKLTPAEEEEEEEEEEEKMEEESRKRVNHWMIQFIEKVFRKSAPTSMVLVKDIRSAFFTWLTFEEFESHIVDILMAEYSNETILTLLQTWADTASSSSSSSSSSFLSVNEDSSKAFGIEWTDVARNMIRS